MTASQCCISPPAPMWAKSTSSPAKYYDNNVAGTLSLLAGMRAAGRNKLVFSSTCAVYGQPASVPITEATRTDPINPYGASKLMVERILADFRSAYGLHSIALRYFNACGADLDCEIGELRDPETHLIPRAMMALQGHVPEFTVFGTDFDTPDGTAIRDYVHVADLAAGHSQHSRFCSAVRPAAFTILEPVAASQSWRSCTRLNSKLAQDSR